MPARSTNPPLSPVASLVRRHDPDRFLAALLAPPARREAQMLLYAFNHELARASEVASNPTLALIRLQWWREVVEGARRRHEVAGPLGEAIDGGALQPQWLAAMIEGREAETDAEMPTLEAFEGFLRGTAGALAAAAARALGADEAQAARIGALGTAYGLAGQLRTVAVRARAGRCLLPHDLLAAQGLTPDAVIAQPDAPALRPVIEALADTGRFLLDQHGGRIPRSLISAALPAVLARRDLRRPWQPAAPRGAADRLAVLGAALRRTV
jgi:phytoene synthase